jgi:mono/diheme cytochrome c family protein
MLKYVIIAFALSAGIAPSAHGTEPSTIERGRYVAMIGGCNDCHSAGFAPSGGALPEAQWLTGDVVGFTGPWGTTYPTNLRRRLTTMDENTWVAFARSMKARPPMPYWALNAMSESDLRAFFRFVRSLGPAGTDAPSALAPGVEPQGPVVRFPAPPRDVARVD